MQGGGKGTADQQQYINTTVLLEMPEPGFADTAHLSGEVYMTTPRSIDGGKTWTIDRLILGAMFPGTEHEQDQRFQ